MKRKSFWGSLGLLVSFGLWTAAVCLVDVQAIGPQGSKVGFATLNRFVHQLTGVNWTLYTITDWLGLVPLAAVVGFGLLGVTQWVKRRGMKKVDRSILVLGGFYLTVLAFFVFFEMVVINYRPVLIEGLLEASYPSSTTMLALCVIPTAMMEMRRRIRGKGRLYLTTLMVGFTAFMVVGRSLSGVHWISDIIGGALLSAGLVWMYAALCGVNQMCAER